MDTNENLLPDIDIRNPKDVIIKALKGKITELGNLNVPIDIVREYPQKESFLNRKDGTFRLARKIVVKKNSNDVNNYAIGNEYGNSVYNKGDLTLVLNLGWEDKYSMEISVWSPDSADRDNLVELIKLWMLEFEQRELDDGSFYFLSYGIHSIRFINAKERINNNLTLNGPMYIGILTYEMIASFTGKIVNEFERYNFLLDAVKVGGLDPDGTTPIKNPPIIIDIGDEGSGMVNCLDCEID